MYANFFTFMTEKMCNSGQNDLVSGKYDIKNVKENIWHAN